ncbi:Putative regulatory protein, RecX family [Latilactobacillus sakei subsp. sakei 23K]|jgi:regulatory protein|uniref:Regulatory protein RecX n=3 Tax=Bacteria TaxID=2 RepID=Q38VK4_LATSS|nr:Putative regulatory protein, RecX family [Latilactobacillus sakei subsp. sakei 23K]SON65707.1 Regulatory protein RecX [Latilactobacillus sakei]
MSKRHVTGENKMPQITKITSQKQKGRYNIFIDEQFAFGVTESVLIKFRLAKGLEIDSSLQRDIQKEDDNAKAYQLALNYLSHQLRTEKELTQYLRDHEITPEGIETSLTKLRELHYLDDQDYADSYVRTVINTSDKGPKVVRQKLIQKGVSANHIDQALTLYTDEEQVTVGLATAQKLAKKYRHSSFFEQQQKIKQGLMQKGFGGDNLSRIIDELALEEDSDSEADALAALGEKKWRRYRLLEPRERRMKMQQALYRKGFNIDAINRFIDDQEVSDDTE